MSKDTSSETHVAPAFDAISGARGGLQHLVEVLNKRISGGHIKIPVRGVDWQHVEWSYESASLERKETKRRSPVAFLQELVKNPSLVQTSKVKDVKDPEVKVARLRVWGGHASEFDRQAAIADLDWRYRFGLKGGDLYALEGNTQPDVCIKTNRFYLLVEGKHTEGALKQNTTWVRNRDQLVRHIDAFLDNTDGDLGSPLPVFGIEIVSKFNESRYDFDSQHERKNFDVWLPHRSNAVRTFVCENCIIPHMTWEELQASFSGIANWEYGKKSKR